MSESKYTPGPWYATPDPDKMTWWISQQPEGGTFWIAEAVDGLMNDETEPNARLIAAAPELLEACKSAYHLLQKLGGKNHDPEFSELQAAIAKAKGGE